MHGNVDEWCQDWYGAYATSAQTDPQGPSTGSYPVRRGGSFYNSAQIVRSADRNLSAPGYGHYGFGFRLLRTE
jgi:sulfatase modifying factor 1